MALRTNISGGMIKGLHKLETALSSLTQFRGRVTGSNSLPTRYELQWIGGVYGIPSASADIVSATEATNITCDRNFEIVGDNATTDDALIYVEGGIEMTTSGTDADECVLAPHLNGANTDQTAWTGVTWGTDQETEWECTIQTAGSIASCAIWAGLKLTNTDVVITDANQVFFRYESGVNSGGWQTVYSIADTDTAADSGVVAVAINTIYHLKIAIDKDRVARFYIDGNLVGTSTALTDAIDFIPYIGVGERGASAAKSVRVFNQAISRKYGA